MQRQSDKTSDIFFLNFCNLLIICAQKIHKARLCDKKEDQTVH